MSLSLPPRGILPLVFSSEKGLHFRKKRDIMLNAAMSRAPEYAFG